MSTAVQQHEGLISVTESDDIKATVRLFRDKEGTWECSCKIEDSVKRTLQPRASDGSAT
jgi:hypothetical protein